MDFDIDKVVNDMLAVIKSTAEDSWGEAKEVGTKFLESRKERLQMIAEARITGELTADQFKYRMEDEKLIAESELNAIAAISKAVAQKAANAAIEVLEKAVIVAIKTAL